MITDEELEEIEAELENKKKPKKKRKCFTESLGSAEEILEQELLTLPKEVEELRLSQAKPDFLSGITNPLALRRKHKISVRALIHSIYAGTLEQEPWINSVVRQLQDKIVFAHTFLKSLEAVCSPILKELSFISLDALKNQLHRLHANSLERELSVKEMAQLTSIVTEVHKLALLTDGKATEIIGHQTLTPDQVKDGMAQLREADRGVIDWDDIPKQ